MARAYRQRCILDMKQLQERAAYWSELLRLQDWIIYLDIVHEGNMPDDADATCEMAVRNKEARIEILDPKYKQPYDFHDMEALLVHELLHIHFHRFELGDEDDGPEPLNVNDIEQVIESVTHALMIQEREKQKQADQIEQLKDELEHTIIGHAITEERESLDD
jgi:hypothetical protein